MLRNTDAVSKLQEGCQRLHIPSSTAMALVQFLKVKRVHDEFVRSRSLCMSPGAALDKLWHYMLLNTKGRRCCLQLCLVHGKYMGQAPNEQCAELHSSVPPGGMGYAASCTGSCMDTVHGISTQPKQLMPHFTTLHCCDTSTCPCVSSEWLQCLVRCISWWVGLWSTVALMTQTCQTSRSCCSACTASTSCAWRDWTLT